MRLAKLAGATASGECAFLDAAVVMALLDFNLRLGRKAPHVNRSFANRCPLVGDPLAATP